MSFTTKIDWIRRCISGYSLELRPQQIKRLPSFVNFLNPGSVVTVTLFQGETVADTISACQILADAQMTPVPHVPARSFESFTAVEDYFAKLSAIGVRELLVVGGDNAEPIGPLVESLQILESGLLQKYNFDRIGVAAHPEGHSVVEEDIMTEAAVKKAQWARANGIDMYYQTQFCFDHKALIDWECRLRSLLVQRLGTQDNVSLPKVHLGVAGPASALALMKYSTVAGVGASLDLLTKYRSNHQSLLKMAAPDALIAGIASHFRDDPETLFDRLHFYPFGGIPSTLNWANKVANGNVCLGSGETAFEVRESALETEVVF